MEILVCIKRVPAVGAKISLTDDGTAIDTRHLGFTIGPHEECAVEEAVRLAARHGGRVTVASAGPPEAAEQLRYALSMGADRAALAETGTTELDPQATAAALVELIASLWILRSASPQPESPQDLAPSEGPRESAFDLILFGNESADAGHYQVGIRVACALGLPIVGGVKGIEVLGDRLRLRRDVADGVEVYETELPAAVAVKEGLNLPRYPTIQGRLRAKKAAVHTVASSPHPSGTQPSGTQPSGTQPSGAQPSGAPRGGLRTLGLRTPQEKQQDTVTLGYGAEAADAVLDMLREKGLVRS